ncbi:MULTISPECIES: AraC family transcriptional regulator [Sutcliffiella]|uniref:AraC family transcriptional regulator n=1 Tax=Sutcliffiella cohnii TaxID=33932 RepID=A0A223KM29_9BACI|nr:MULTISPECIES: AraC family transcriptional regulator [Sutcliffiella]AST90560.1 AraC family transcriptional regulator [Sutcliffiella cohnii]WBL17512.1 AraC family transcriptional regulator [Sutcliffiella sp. NC1]
MIALPIPPFPTFITGGQYFAQKGTRHFHRTFPVFDLLYVRKGMLFLQEENRQYDIGPGQYLILVPDTEHKGYRDCEEETDVIWLHFTVPLHNHLIVKDQAIDWSYVYKKEATFTEPAEYSFLIPQFGQLKRKDIMEQHLQQLIQTDKEQDHSPDDYLQKQLAFSELFIQLQREAFSIPTATEKVCEKAMKYIQDYFQSPFKMKKLSEELMFHPDYITRCMQKTIGMTPVQYVTYYRLNLAKRMLVQSDEKVATIAKEVGIDDVTYFSKLFKKEEGLTPLEYRRLVRRE